MQSGPLQKSLIMAGGIDIGVPIDNSCRFNDDDSASMTQTTGQAPDDGTLWVFSAWVKLADIGITFGTMFSGGDSTSNYTRLGFSSGNALFFQKVSGGATAAQATSNMLFRDPTAWYHILVVYDSDQASSTDRLDMYVNGVEITWTEDNAIESAALTHLMSNGLNASIGKRGADNSLYFDGYMAEVHFLDGVAGTTTDFGKFNAQGHWVPQVYSGAHGTNGFYLDFANSADFGNDVSGSANHFTDSGLATNDQMSDTPTDNYATMNPLATDCVLSEGNLKIDTPNTDSAGIATMPSSSDTKWYWEATLDHNDSASLYCGLVNTVNHMDQNGGYATVNYRSLHLGTSSNEGKVWDGTAFSASYDTAIAVTQVFMFARDGAKLWIGKDGTWYNSGDPAAGTGEVLSNLSSDTPDGNWYPGIFNDSASVDMIMTFNFGQSGFTHTVPVGFKALSTSNLPEPTIPKGSDYFDIITYTGDDTAARAITGLDFSPDVVWFKTRNAANSHMFFDTLRGAAVRLAPNSTSTETAEVSTQLDSFDSGGFTVTHDATEADLNASAHTYVSWCWKEGSVPGFDIITFSGDGINGRTIAHSLGVAPNVVCVKERTNDVGSWRLYHHDTLNPSSVPVADPETDRLLLEDTAALTDEVSLLNDTAPDTSNVTVGNHDDVNSATDTYVLYLFAEVAGFSRFGSYVGNGSTDGPFIFTGFRPRFVMRKRTDTVGSWSMIDSARQTGNVKDNPLYADSANAEATVQDEVDFLSNGFKMRSLDVRVNASSGEYVYMAFAEHPFKYARAF